MSEHGLHAVCTLGVLAEAGLALDWHPGVLGDLAQLVCETPEIEVDLFWPFHYGSLISFINQI